MTPLTSYLAALRACYQTGTATEHTYRPALQQLLAALAPDTVVTNEPKHIACGAPDFVITRNGIPLGYIEAKDLGKDLDDPAHAAQLARYTASLDNLIFTNYLEFRLYKDGQLTARATLAHLADGQIKPAQKGKNQPPDKGVNPLGASQKWIGGFAGAENQPPDKGVARPQNKFTKRASGGFASAENQPPEKGVGFAAPAAKAGGYSGQHKIQPPEKGVNPLGTSQRRIGGFASAGIHPGQDTFHALYDSFLAHQGQTILTAADLAQGMAAKARLLAAVITEALGQDHDPADRSAGPATNANPGQSTGQNPGPTLSESQNDLRGQHQAFQKHLIHDITPAAFADIYAQTVAYGMFAARLHAPLADTFTRQIAAEHIPAANPFLRKFFQHIAGYDLDARIRWLIDNLADLFRAADVGELMKTHGKATQRQDPFLHFYETFLGAYNPRLRKSRGVYYTPAPVVHFIVRAVDDILRRDFSLPDGLADTSQTDIALAAADGKTRKQRIHKVQILDPAAGTGTFLAAIVQHIYDTAFINQRGIWANYVHNNLIPRLNGFEVLMASYAMAHIKLQMVLRDSGCALRDQRLRIFLTNALEEHHPDTGSLFAQWLATEAREANSIKRDTPVMVVIGNPPYSVESANTGDWISSLLKNYKQEPGGGKLKEKSSKSLNDDYVKFLRYGQHFVDRTGEGILAYINNHGFLDSPTFRGMRWSLLQSFDDIYILDLHGNARKKETAPDGSADQNVFDIMQGVSINLFVKTGNKKPGTLARVFHYDLYGHRQAKYEFLWGHELQKVDFQELQPQAPAYFFMPTDYALQAEYENGFSVKDLFIKNGSGICTKRDNLSVHFSSAEAQQAAQDILAMEKDAFYRKYNLPKDVRDWRYEWAKDDIATFGVSNELIRPINYRPFDMRSVVYTGRTKGFIGWPVVNIMRHMFSGDNVGICFPRMCKGKGGFHHCIVGNTLIDRSLGDAYSGAGTHFAPLYLYPDTAQQNMSDAPSRTPNLNADIVARIADSIALRFVAEKANDTKTFAPLDVLDYLYAALHSPAYRQKYNEFLKIDFPRVPYPKSAAHFRALAKLGAELRALHLMQHPAQQKLITAYPTRGDNLVTKVEYKLTNPKARLGNVHINATQHFAGVPETAWQFPIGGYLPAQKWLKDRKGRTLTHTDVTHYQKIIIALAETARLMQEIDKIN